MKKQVVFTIVVTCAAILRCSQQVRQQLRWQRRERFITPAPCPSMLM